ncbi:hypothetical protein PSENEW3n2_00005418 [Picochlorum sp. SENEW3]|nr:hypothetical protein PSENEW3n2_00005418 [Picochlorum sp. SENEW3]WPT17414.1 hypothetical protein PSENEW3_00005418 [Picochlorum sp. SENEW3]
MSATQPVKNIYKDIKNDPETVRKRQEKKKRLQNSVEKIIKGITSRKTVWAIDKVMDMDALCLKHGKRCIMWDDEGNGFYLLLNWDWSANRPREETGQENAWDPGWYSNAASILRPPLLDPSVPATELAQWIDNNTIAIHHLLLPHIDQITKSDEASFAFSLPSNNSYWEQLQSRM